MPGFLGPSTLLMLSASCVAAGAPTSLLRACINAMRWFSGRLLTQRFHRQCVSSCCGDSGGGGDSDCLLAGGHVVRFRPCTLPTAAQATVAGCVRISGVLNEGNKNEV